MEAHFFNTLVPALLHTLWVGLAAAVLLFLALRKLTVENARLRYGLGILALLTVFIGGLVVWELPNPKVETSSVVSFQDTQLGAPVPSDQPQTANVQLQTVSSQLKSSNSKSPLYWRLWLGFVWMAGAVISLLRLVRLSFGIQQFVQRCRQVDNPVAGRLLAELSQIAGTTRRIILLTGEHIVQPAVTGIFRPAIFLPLSVLTGLPEWQLRAILAHELAHIVRHDFLANALQLLAETILFFNPAVWWINRRIREEREACCDALAAEWIDSKTALAETLLEQAAVHTSALPAFGGPNPGSLKNRILRLINPAQQPALKLPWKSLLLVALFAIVGLILAKKGAEELVGYLKRIDAVDETRLEYATPGQQVAQQETLALDEITIDFTIATEDGSALQLPIKFSFSGGENYSASHHYFEDFEHITCVHSNLWQIQLKVLKRGLVSEYWMGGKHYAETTGPGGIPDANGYIQLPLIKLSKGFVGKVRFFGPDRQPVPGVKVSMSGDYEIISTSGQDGISTFPKSQERMARIDIIPPVGFCCQDKIPITFTKGEIADCELKQGALFMGRIINSEGAAIQNAKISLRLPGPHQKFNCGYLPFVQSGDDGRFKIQWVDPELESTLFIEAPGYMGKWVALEGADDAAELTYVMQPARKLTMVLKNMGNRDRFNLSGHFEEHRFQYFPPSHLRRISKADHEEVYELDLWETTYMFRATWQNGLAHHVEFITRFDGRKVPEKLVLDLNDILGDTNTAIPHRFRLQFIPPDGEPMPQGTVEIGEKIEATKKYALPEGGLIESEIIMPPRTPLMVRAKSMRGYTIHQMIDPISTNYIADCQLEPAGGIAISCFYPDGTKATQYSVYTGTRSIADHDARYYHPIIYTAPDEYTCMREPLALATKQHRISIRKNRPDSEGGDLHFRSDWITLTEDEPVKKLKCVLKPVSTE